MHFIFIIVAVSSKWDFLLPIMEVLFFQTNAFFLFIEHLFLSISTTQTFMELLWCVNCIQENNKHLTVSWTKKNYSKPRSKEFITNNKMYKKNLWKNKSVFVDWKYLQKLIFRNFPLVLFFFCQFLMLIG